MFVHGIMKLYCSLPFIRLIIGNEIDYAFNHVAIVQLFDGEILTNLILTYVRSNVKIFTFNYLK